MMCVCVCFQDLLQLQYEGVAVMKMFDKAKVNVNLLIFLLNKKFFKKWNQVTLLPYTPIFDFFILTTNSSFKHLNV